MLLSTHGRKTQQIGDGSLFQVAIEIALGLIHVRPQVERVTVLKQYFQFHRVGEQSQPTILEGFDPNHRQPHMQRAAQGVLS